MFELLLFLNTTGIGVLHLTVDSEELNSVQFSFDFFFLYRAFYSKIVSVLYKDRTPEPELPGKHSGKEKLSLNRKKP